MWVGNVFVCDNKDVKLTLVVDGQADGRPAFVELHNPTDLTLNVSVRSPAGAPMFGGMATTVKLPAGDSVRLESTRSGLSRSKKRRYSPRPRQTASNTHQRFPAEDSIMSFDRYGRAVRRLAFVLFCEFCAVASASATPPDWLADPGNSLWVALGGPGGVAEIQGVHVLDKLGDGDLQPATFGGINAGQSVMPDGQPGNYYFVAEPWEKFRAWLGTENDVLLTLRYFDGTAGNFVVSYDSSDPRVKHDPYPPGVCAGPMRSPTADRSPAITRGRRFACGCRWHTSPSEFTAETSASKRWRKISP